MRSMTSRESLSCWTRFAATASACARSCSSRNDLGARAMLFVRRLLDRGGPGATPGDAEQLGEGGRAVGQPAGPVDRESAHASAWARVAQRRLPAAIVDQPAQRGGD